MSDTKQVNHVLTKIEDKNSCEFSINAKGLWSGKVKVYADDAHSAFNKAEDLAASMECLLQKKNHPGDSQ